MQKGKASLGQTLSDSGWYFYNLRKAPFTNTGSLLGWFYYFFLKAARTGCSSASRFVIRGSRQGGKLSSSKGDIQEKAKGLSATPGAAGSPAEPPRGIPSHFIPLPHRLFTEKRKQATRLLSRLRKKKKNQTKTEASSFP